MPRHSANTCNPCNPCNPQRAWSGTVCINKTVIPATEASFNFTIFPAMNGVTGFTLSTNAQGKASQCFVNVPPGQYTITEDPGDWIADKAQQIAYVAAGITTTLEFVNRAAPSLTLIKTIANFAGTDATFTFQVNPDGSGLPDLIELTTVNGSTAATFTDLVPGTYTITEDPQVGWVPQPSQQFTLVAGETTTLTFVNTQLSKFKINKTTVPGSGDATFTFRYHYTEGDMYTASITTSNGTGSIEVYVPDGAIVWVQELLPLGWIPTPSTSMMQMIQTSLSLGTLNVYFENQAVGTLTVTKQVLPPQGYDRDFYFQIQPAINGITDFHITTTDGTGTWSMQNVPVNTYTITEIVPEGYAVTANPQTMPVIAGSSETLTFLNVAVGTIEITKRIPQRLLKIPDGDYTFTIKLTNNNTLTSEEHPITVNVPDDLILDGYVNTIAFAALAGPYTVEEINLPTDFTLNSLTPSNFTLNQGDTVAVTVINDYGKPVG